MLKELLDEKGLSVYRVSKDSGIPYTTLNELLNGKKDPQDCSIRTIARLSAYMNMSIDSVYSVISGSKQNGRKQIRWEDTRNKQYVFPVVCACNNPQINRIHPLKQRKIVGIFDALQEDRRIDQLIVFGSSANIRCSKDSDIDLLVGLAPSALNLEDRNDVSEIIQKSCEWDADILWKDRLSEDSRIYKTAMKGVRLL